MFIFEHSEIQTIDILSQHYVMLLLGFPFTNQQLVSSDKCGQD